ncbi:MAG TPA: 50S ribosomal protein L4 [Candidatus Dependentiae bacterium]|nr:50S ribosomal protein L4 [Candidatus Dependentiae bacterium]HRQ62299.1 50S ribosomal protein L4 [Candidatus Dependentiae bacterium]
MKNTKEKQDMRHMVVTYADLGIENPVVKKSNNSFSTWIRVLMQNWRQGTVSSKGRSDVARSGKKPWKQKGTGRARAGSSRSPVWRGGGVAFGPQARTRVIKVNQKQKKAVLQQLLADYVGQGRISWVDWSVQNESPNTALAYETLNQAQFAGKRINLFLSPDDMLTYASFANIPKVRVLYFDQPNAFDLANGEHWVFLKKDLDMFKGMVSKWH